MKGKWKFIYKCTLIFTLSFFLLNIQIFSGPQEGQVYFSSAYGEEAPANHTSANTQLIEGQINQSAEMAGASQSKGEQALDVLIGMAAGYVSMRLPIYCAKITLDLGLAIAAGVAYIAGELVALNKFKELKKEIVHLTFDIVENKVDDAQLEVLKSQKKAYQGMVKAAEWKRNFRYVAATAYGAAAVAAGMAEIKEATIDAGVATFCPGATATFLGMKVFNRTMPKPSTASNAETTADCAAVVNAAAAYMAIPTVAGTPLATACATAVAPFSAQCIESTAVCVPAAMNAEKAAVAAEASANSLDSNTTVYPCPDCFGAGTIEVERLPDLSLKSGAILNLYNKISIPNKNILFSTSGRIKNKSINTCHTENAMTADLSARDEWYEKMSFSGIKNPRPVAIEENKEARNGGGFSNVNSALGLLLAHRETLRPGTSLKEELASFLKNGLLDFFVSPVVAGGNSLAMFGAIALTLILIATGVFEALDLLMISPFNRAIAFGVLSTLMFASVKQTDEIIHIAKDNIRKIDRLIAGMVHTENLAQGTEGIEVEGGTAVDIGNTPFIPFNVGVDRVAFGQGVTAPCPDKNSGSEINCKPMNSIFPRAAGFSSLPGNLQNFSTDLFSAVDSMTGQASVSSAGLGGLNSVAGGKSAIDSLRRQVEQKINHLRQQSKKNPVDFRKKEDELLSKLRSSAARVLATRGLSASSVLSGLGANPLSPLAKEESKPLQEKLGEASVAALKSGGEGLGEFSLEADRWAGAVPKAAEGVLPKEELDGDVAIHQNVEASLFRIITDRYMKTAYPILGKRVLR